MPITTAPGTSAAGGGVVLRSTAGQQQAPQIGVQFVREKHILDDRRTSLPAGPLTQYKAPTNVQEARGIAAELLLRKDLPPKVTSALKYVTALLNPIISSPSLSDLSTDLAAMTGTPFIGESVSLTPEVANARRQSLYTWSTVTSASGLPELDPEPRNTRSLTGRKLTDPQAHKYVLHDRKHSAANDENGSIIKVSDGTAFDVETMCSKPELQHFSLAWDFDIFSYFEASPDTIITEFMYKAFQQLDLFNIFRIDERKFVNFFHDLERGYLDLPYHNRMHAADVVQCVSYLTQNPIPALTDAENGLSDIFSSLELMALYAAAAMHDFDHPGRTNAFLVATGDPKALLYNDRSVLENHHAAASWKLLLNEKNNFVDHLEPTEFKRFRYIVVEAILSTDLKRHFEILLEFDEKAGIFEWENENDRLLLSQICIKMADINSPTKSFELHQEWTKRILEEFYCQGDEERRLGLPVSAYMDINETGQVSKLQDSFLAHLVKPLVYSMQSSGLLPVSGQKDRSKNVVQNDCKTVSRRSSETTESELIINIERNHRYWKKELDDDDTVNNQEAEERKPSKTDSEMETIQEDDEADDL